VIPVARMMLNGGTGVPGVVTLSSETVSDTQVAPTDSFCSIRFTSGGIVEKSSTDSPTWTQVDSGTDWVIPNGVASSLFEIRCASITTPSSDPFTTQPAAVGTWIDLGTTRTWTNTETGSNNVLFTEGTFQIRYNGGPVLSQGVYILDVSTDG